MLPLGLKGFGGPVCKVETVHGILQHMTDNYMRRAGSYQESGRPREQAGATTRTRRRS